MEHSTYQKALADTTQMYERKIAELKEQLEDERSRFEDLKEQFNLAKKLRHQQSSMKVNFILKKLTEGFPCE